MKRYASDRGVTRRAAGRSSGKGGNFGFAQFGSILYYPR